MRQAGLAEIACGWDVTEAKLISVIMPAYNVAAYVEVAVSSVERQTWPNLQLVAIDDGSMDGTAERLADLARNWQGDGRSFDLVRQQNAGAGAARNAGLDAARGELVAFLDADDHWHPDLLAELAATLRDAPDLDMTFPRYRYIDADGEPIGVETTARQERYSAVDLMVANPVHSATGVLLRRAAVQRAGRFDTSLSACIDLDFWTRIGSLGPRNIGPTNAALAFYRKREGQITGDWRRMERSWLRVCEKLEEAGAGLSPRQFRDGRARHCLFWATAAYNAGEYRAARRLIAETWRLDPGFAARTPLARIRTLAALASLLPARTHSGLRERFNGRRSRCHV
jgi:glycosyltransferase involved in cell wall biosynthesis